MNLRDLSVKAFDSEVASASPAPGGGSVAALCGALGASLCQMAAGLTLGKKKYEAAFSIMQDIRQQSMCARETLLSLVDEDTQAYNQVIAAFRLPKSRPDEMEYRRKAIQEALKQAALTPFHTLEAASSIIGLVELTMEKANPACITDVGVAAELAAAAVNGALYNVCINLKSIDDQIFAKDLRKKSLMIQEDICHRMERIRKKIVSTLNTEP